MNKFLKIFGSGLFVFSSIFALASCDEKAQEQKVNIKDDNGKTVEVLIKPSKEKNDVKNAMSYAAQADYSDVKIFSVDLNTTHEIKFSKDSFLNASLTTDVDLDLENIVIWIEGNADVKGKMPEVEIDTEGNAIEKLVEHSANGNFHLSFDKADPNLYVGANARIDNEQINQKIKLSFNDIIGSIGGVVPGLPGELPNLPTNPAIPFAVNSNLPIMTPKFDSNDINEAIKAFFDNAEKYLPNSSFEVSKVDKKEFELRYSFSLKELIEKVDPELTTEFKEILKNDANMNINFIFDTTTGYFKGVKFDYNNSLIANLIQGEVNVDASAKGSFSCTFNLNNGTINKITNKDDYQFFPTIDENPSIKEPTTGLSLN